MLGFLFALAALTVVVVSVWAETVGGSTGGPGPGRRDEVFDGVAPGVLPADPATAPRRRATTADLEAPVVVRFDPPQGTRPEHAGLLRDAKVTSRDLTAAILDLAVARRITLTREQQVVHHVFRADTTVPGWRITAMSGPRDDDPPVRHRLMHVFGSTPRGTSTLRDLKPWLSAAMPEVRNGLAQEPEVQSWYPLMRDGTFGFGAKVRGGARRRSAEGTALRAQLAGFALYLETAEAAQLRTEEGAGLFSRYLPHAAALGLTQQWVQTFKEAAQGLDDPVVASSWGSDLQWWSDDLATGLGDGLSSLADSFADSLGDLADSFDGLADGIADLADSIGDSVSDSGGDGGGGDGGDGGGGDGGGGGD